MKIIISGAMGHMGKTVAEQAIQAGEEIAFGVDVVPGNAAYPVYTGFDAAPAMEDTVIIDFSKPDGLTALLAYAVQHHVPCVLCTTGYTAEQEKQVDDAAKEIPVFRSANMSIGIALLRQLARKAAKVLGDAYDVEIVEMHHRRKVDAPSGTALMLYNAVADAYDEPRNMVCGRSGNHCKRTHNEIGMHSVRGGTIAGEHEVMFLGEAERVTVSHSAENRSVFAVGALRAACFLADKPAGRYDMDDMLAD